MNCHLVSVEVSVKRLTYQGMYSNGFTFHQDRLKCLNTKSVQRRRPVEDHRMFSNNFLQNFPNFVGSLLGHFLGALNGGSVSLLLKPADDKGFEQLKGHLSWQTTLVHAQFRSYHYHRSTGVINSLAQKVLSESAGLTLQHIAE